jgi:hypothetical protein
LPSIIPSYVYTLFASMIVGVMLIFAFDTSAIAIKNEADQQEMKSLATYIAAKSYELVSSATTNNASAMYSLNVPVLVGNKQYWVQFADGSGTVRVNVGFGTTSHSTEFQVAIPTKATASGTYISGSSILVIQCSIQEGITHLEMFGGSPR